MHTPRHTESDCEIESVVVIGGSIAGLLAAAAAAPHVREVVVLERDDVDHPGHRPSTPQARHSHGLLAGGRLAMETLLPGLTADLLAHGARSDGDIGEVGRWWVGGGLLADTVVGQRGLGVSRHLLERTVRRHVRNLDNVVLRCATTVDALLGDRRRVRGVRTRDGLGRPAHLTADVVVDASGRPGRAARWLGAIGAGVPHEERVTVGVRYATTHVAARDGDAGGRSFVISAATPGTPRCGVALLQEDGTWTITLATYGDEPLPRDADGLLDVARSLVSPDLAVLLDGRAPEHETWTYRFPDCRRRRFERVPDLPLGYAPIGDAICSFDPTFGQGMSVAAQEAVALRDALPGGLRAVRSGYLDAAAAVVDVPWSIAVGALLALPGVTPGPETRSNPLLGRYVRLLQRVATQDPDVAAAFLRVTNLLEPPASLLAPRIVGRVLGGAPRSRAAA